MAGEITIVGAGLAGLVASINLVRQGRKVVVLEAKKSLGGEHSYADSSYIDPVDIETRLGVDIRPALEPWPYTRIYAYGKKHEVTHPPDKSAFTILRGKDGNSIENVLLRQAVEAGVEVEFGRRLAGDEFAALPTNSIIATGLSADAFRSLDIPHKPFHAHMATGKGSPDRPPVIVYFDSFCREFGYYFQARDSAGALVFNVDRAPTKAEKQTFIRKLEQNDGISFDNWNDHLAQYAAWPLGSLDNRRLFWKDKILAGTVAGMVSPVMVFGVHGALVSGHVAALAVSDREAARKAFRAMAPWHYYYPQLAFRVLRETAPHALLKPLIRAICGTYHPTRFPHLMKFAMRPPGMA